MRAGEIDSTSPASLVDRFAPLVKRVGGTWNNANTVDRFMQPLRVICRSTPRWGRRVQAEITNHLDAIQQVINETTICRHIFTSRIEIRWHGDSDLVFCPTRFCLALNRRSHGGGINQTCCCFMAKRFASRSMTLYQTSRSASQK